MANRVMMRLSLVTAVLVAVAGCAGSGPDDSPIRAGISANAAVPTAPSSGPDVTPCADLLASGWQPPAEEAPDISWDPETGIAQVSFTGERLVINVIADAKCRELPVIGPMIGRMVDDGASGQ